MSPPSTRTKPIYLRPNPRVVVVVLVKRPWRDKLTVTPEWVWKNCT